MANTTMVQGSSKTSNDNGAAFGSNVLAEGAGAEERDVHWYFNWADGETAPMTVHVFSASMAGRVQSSPIGREFEPSPNELRAAGRARRIRAGLVAAGPQHTQALARWSASPRRLPEAVVRVFGRLAAVTAMTDGYREIGEREALVEACELLLAPKAKHDEPASFRRHLAKVKVDVIRRQAEAIMDAAWLAYRTARSAQPARPVALRASARVLDALVAATSGDGAAALAAIMEGA